MYTIGHEEIDAVSTVISAKSLYRYGIGQQCNTFERRYAEYLGLAHCALTASGTNALTAAVMALRIGPGDEVLVPAHTYMATALAVLAAGAIPVIVDIDESITLDPTAVANAIGPCTKAVIPVHMWGVACDMDAIMAIAAKHDLLVIEDSCQAVGGGYHGRKLGSIGHVGAFSFNYYKNMTAGEGGAVVTNDPDHYARARCVVDPCHFYWTGRSEDMKPFASNGARPSELMAAVLNVQLDRIDGIIETMRGQKRRILAGTSHLAELGLEPVVAHSPDHDCAAQVMYRLPTSEQASQFASIFPSVVIGRTGRHNYTEWDQVLMHKGAAHPLMNPYQMDANKKCRRDYSKDMCAHSLAILHRTVMVATDPAYTTTQIEKMIANIEAAARVTFGQIDRNQAVIRDPMPIDTIKFDLQDPALAESQARTT